MLFEQVEHLEGFLIFQHERLLRLIHSDASYVVHEEVLDQLFDHFVLLLVNASLLLD